MRYSEVRVSGPGSPRLVVYAEGTGPSMQLFRVQRKSDEAQGTAVLVYLTSDADGQLVDSEQTATLKHLNKKSGNGQSPVNKWRRATAEDRASCINMAAARARVIRRSPQQSQGAGAAAAACASSETGAPATRSREPTRARPPDEAPDLGAARDEAGGASSSANALDGAEELRQTLHGSAGGRVERDLPSCVAEEGGESAARAEESAFGGARKRRRAEKAAPSPAEQAAEQPRRCAPRRTRGLAHSARSLCAQGAAARPPKRPAEEAAAEGAAAAEEAAAEEAAAVDEAPTDFVQCDKCGKWRRLRTAVLPSSLPGEWECALSDDPLRKRCSCGGGVGGEGEGCE